MTVRCAAWQRITVDGEVTARVTCPCCGNDYTLDHDIADDGTVTPSLYCPNDDCDFHDMMQLVDWMP